MPDQFTDTGFFSERHGLVQQPAISFREDLPARLREALIKIIRPLSSASFLWERVKRILNPYGIAEEPKGRVLISEGENDRDFIAAKRALMFCDWFRIYDVIEDLYAQQVFHETELCDDPDEAPRAAPFQRELNNFFRHAGIGWQMIDGKIVARGDDAFELTVRSAETELKAVGRATAANRIESAIRDLSLRPKADLSGAVNHATGAMECVLHDVTGEAMTFGDYVKSYPAMFPGAMKKAFVGLWGYASEEARHGKEGRELPREDAEFIVSIAAALTTYLNRKHPRA